ncbi:hypothetical protein L9F63_001973 [Diploptera punctata]|uniref:Farnesol dehydrogenase n=1 Tax=Diploptera punctata TaxID=6984 RepID=A0AAD8A2Z9_DIPPU|nr:hypothetical protein L9F63_001973 [Diploptera punctata]
MERWSGKVAVVTGASSGIGAAITKNLLKYGVHVVGLARRINRIEEFSVELQDSPGKLYPVKCDVSLEQDILEAFSWINKTLGTLHILINNAGVFNETQLHDFITEEWLNMMNVNVLGLTICTREALKMMKEHGVNDGHIININSFLGHTMSNNPVMNMYATTKHAVTASTEGLRRELVQQNSQIRISSVSPGIVKTEMFTSGGTRTLGPEIYNVMTCLEAKDVSDAVLYILGTPPHVQVHELTILPIGQPS